MCNFMLFGRKIFILKLLVTIFWTKNFGRIFFFSKFTYCQCRWHFEFIRKKQIGRKFWSVWIFHSFRILQYSYVCCYYENFQNNWQESFGKKFQVANLCSKIWSNFFFRQKFGQIFFGQKFSRNFLSLLEKNWSNILISLDFSYIILQDTYVCCYYGKFQQNWQECLVEIFFVKNLLEFFFFWSKIQLKFCLVKNLVEFFWSKIWSIFLVKTQSKFFGGNIFFGFENRLKL